MWNMNEVADILYRGDHTYWIQFDDGLEAEIDFTSYLNRGPVFKPLADISFFKQARVILTSQITCCQVS